jgi:hypothetical protein
MRSKTKRDVLEEEEDRGCKGLLTEKGHFLERDVGEEEDTTPLLLLFLDADDNDDDEPTKAACPGRNEAAVTKRPARANCLMVVVT